MPPLNCERTFCNPTKPIACFTCSTGGTGPVLAVVHLPGELDPRNLFTNLDHREVKDVADPGLHGKVNGLACNSPSISAQEPAYTSSECMYPSRPLSLNNDTLTPRQCQWVGLKESVPKRAEFSRAKSQ